MDWNTGYLVASDPQRLAPLAQSMADRFLELQRPDLAGAFGVRAQSSLLATALAALPAREFAAVAEPLIAVAHRNGAMTEYPALSLRLADLGEETYPAFRDRLMNHDATRFERLLSALAICRIGQADGELHSNLRSQFGKADTSEPNDENLKSALFVALKKVEPDDFVKNAEKPGSPQLKSWYEAVLAGRGDTEIGPNNCMSMEWPRPNSSCDAGANPSQIYRRVGKATSRNRFRDFGGNRNRIQYPACALHRT